MYYMSHACDMTWKCMLTSACGSCITCVTCITWITCIFKTHVIHEPFAGLRVCMYVCICICTCIYDTDVQGWALLQVCWLGMYSRSHLGWHFGMLFQSSKLKARTSLFTETWQKRRSSFEVWAFENVTPSGIGCTHILQICWHVWKPLVCISVVIDLLAVWRHNKPKTKKPKTRNKENKAGLSPNTLPEEYLGHNLDEHCLEDTGVTWCLSYIRGGTIPWVLSFLLVGRLDCWDLHASPQTMSLWAILTP